MLDFPRQLVYTPEAMLIDGWLGLALSLVSTCVGVVGVAWAVVGQWGLKRRVLSLEFDMADMQERLLREIKSRAGREGVKAKKDEEEFAARLLQNSNIPKAKNGPWWMEHVHQDLKQ